MLFFLFCFVFVLFCFVRLFVWLKTWRTSLWFLCFVCFEHLFGLVSFCFVCFVWVFLLPSFLFSNCFFEILTAFQEGCVQRFLFFLCLQRRLASPANPPEG